jgi:hypothetical protein
MLRILHSTNLPVTVYMEHPFRIIIWNLPDREHPANALVVQVQVHAPFLRQELIYHITVPLSVHCLALHMHFFFLHHPNHTDCPK